MNKSFKIIKIQNLMYVSLYLFILNSKCSLKITYKSIKHLKPLNSNSKLMTFWRDHPQLKMKVLLLYNHIYIFINLYDLKLYNHNKMTHVVRFFIFFLVDMKLVIIVVHQVIGWPERQVLSSFRCWSNRYQHKNTSLQRYSHSR